MPLIAELIEAAPESRIEKEIGAIEIGVDEGIFLVDRGVADALFVIDERESVGETAADCDVFDPIVLGSRNYTRYFIAEGWYGLLCVLVNQGAKRASPNAPDGAGFWGR